MSKYPKDRSFSITRGSVTRTLIGGVHKVSYINQSDSAVLLMLAVHHILQFWGKIGEIMDHKMKMKVNVQIGFKTQRFSYGRRFMEPVNVYKWGTTVRRIDGVAR
jgi:hypothetical protein